MLDELEDDLERWSAPAAGPLLSGDVFAQPLAALLSKQAVTVEEGTTLKEAVALMRERGYGAIAITRQGKLSGIITERDLVTKVIGVVDAFLDLDVARVMTHHPVALRRGDSIAHVVHNIHVGGYRHVPVIDDEGRPVSIVSIKDVVRFLLNHFPGQVVNTLAEPYRGPVSSDGG